MSRSILKRNYFKEAAENCKSIKMLVIAAVITALRIAVKAFDIPLIPGSLIISFSCYFDVLGSFIYGPVLALFSGAISDTLGAIFFPMGGQYFFPYIIPEMLGSFIYALFLWNRERITVPRILLSRFTVNIICNIILNSIIMKWQFVLYGGENVVYLFSLARVGKNLIMFPLEGVLMAIIINAAAPALKQTGIIDKGIETQKLTKKNVILTALLFVISVLLVLLYIFYLRDFLKLHNIQYI